MSNVARVRIGTVKVPMLRRPPGARVIGVFEENGRVVLAPMRLAEIKDGYAAYTRDLDPDWRSYEGASNRMAAVL